jgi:hypothetical protein
LKWSAERKVRKTKKKRKPPAAHAFEKLKSFETQ